MEINLKGINWRKKLAAVLWVLCVLGSFLPTASSVALSGRLRTITGFTEVSTPERLLLLTIPLIMVWVGVWLLDDDESGAKRAFGIIIELLGWGLFAQNLGFYLLGPLILAIS